MAKAFDIPGLVIVGPTFGKNVSYPKHFDFYRNKRVKAKYSPIRIGGQDSELADRINDEVMNFNSEEVNEIRQKILSNVML